MPYLSGALGSGALGAAPTGGGYVTASALDGTITEALSLGSTLSVSVVYGVVVLEAPELFDIAAVPEVFEDTLTEAVESADSSVYANLYVTTVIDEALFSPSAAQASLITGSLVESVTFDLSAVGIVAFDGTITELMLPNDFIALVRVTPREVVEAVTLTPQLLVVAAPLVREIFEITETMIPGGIYAVSASEEITLSETTVLAFHLPITEALTAADSATPVVAVTIADNVSMLAVATGSSIRGVTITERTQMSDAALRYLGALVAEALAVSDDLDGVARLVASLTEALSLATTATPLLTMSVVLSEGIDLSDEQALSMIFSGVVVEGVEISIGYFSPGGSMTTWTMNVATGAVTEYENYEFNSFAQIGNISYGASVSGLFQLTGDDDDGTSIIAQLQGGYMQFGKSRLSRLKAAYIAVRNDAEFVLRIETAEGATYNYSVVTRNMRTTKVHMGKGQRARYFTYELVSDGSDFDLESLEFVPLVVDRRV